MRTITLTATSLFLWLAVAVAASADDRIAPFVGSYAGSAELKSKDGAVKRDLSVDIKVIEDGFNVAWASTTIDGSGEPSTKTYSIDFLPAGRGDLYSAAMQRNMFGHAVPLDPMKGEPYVWARLVDETLTVFSLFVHNDGTYEIQQFDRTLAEYGLDLQFQVFRDGSIARTLNAELQKQ